MDIPASSSTATSASNSLDGRGAGGGGGSDFLNLGMFGQPSGGVGDLLLGSSGFGGALGNGYGNDPLPSGSSAFDLNDFPSLGGGAGGNNVGVPAPPSNGLASALRQQQQVLAHQQMMQSAAAAGGSKSQSASNLYRLAMQSGANGAQKFSVTTEDFPALPGAPVGGGNGSLTGQPDSSLLLGGNGTSLTAQSTGSSFGSGPVSRGSSGGGLYGVDLDNGIDGSGLLGAGGLGGLGGLTGLQSGSNHGSALLQQRSSTPGSTGAPMPNSGPGSAAGSALGGDFGLLGLLSVIRMTDADRNGLALGTDLTMLGLNLNTNDNLYSNFASPWSDAPTTKEPHFQVRFTNAIGVKEVSFAEIPYTDLLTLFRSFPCATTCNRRRSKQATYQSSS
jgi:CCR4-NOT transcription complex subunit 2